MTEKNDLRAAAEFRSAEQSVEAHSAVFKKELGLMDLALTQVLFIVGLPWIGVAAKQGPSHVVLWLLAMLFFYVPSAVVVVMPTRTSQSCWQAATTAAGSLTGPSSPRARGWPCAP